MTRPHETELRFRELLDLLGLPVPSGVHLVAIARFLEEISPARSADPYLIELVERIPPLRAGGDVVGIDPVDLEWALRTMQDRIASSPVLAGMKATASIRSMYSRGLAQSFWMAGEHTRALETLGLPADSIPEQVAALTPAGTPEALAQAVHLLSRIGVGQDAELGELVACLRAWMVPDAIAVPVVERLPDRSGNGETLQGLLREVRLGEMKWADGSDDEAEANTALADFEGDWQKLLAAPLSAARALLGEGGFRVPARAVNLRVVLDRPGAFHEGMSANLALAGLLFCRFLRMTEAREEYSLRPRIAVSGVIATDGSVHPVESRHLPAKISAAFFSPVRRIVLPAAQLEEARRTLSRLQERYPRRRPELHGVEHLRDLFVDRRLSDHRRISLPDSILRAAWKKRRPIAAGLLVGLAGMLAASWIGPFDRDPVLAAFRGEHLVLQNASGQDIRTITVGRQTVEHAMGLNTGEVQRDVVILRDIDGDGSKEVLYIVHPPEGSRDPQSLVCLGIDDDDPRWTVPGRFQVSFPHKTDITSDAFRLEEIWAGDCDGDGRLEVIVLANHVFFPSVIARLEASTGALEQFYVHVGTLGDLAVVDLDGDGFPEVLACGTNNALNVASLVVLDPRSLRGHSPLAGAYSMDQMARAKERFYILIPRTPLGEAFADRYERNGALNLEVEPGRGKFCVRVQDAGGPAEINGVTFDPVLYYYFGFDLQAQSVATSSEFDTVGRRLWEEGRLKEPPGQAFLEAARRAIHYLKDDDTSRIALSAAHGKVSGSRASSRAHIERGG